MVPDIIPCTEDPVVDPMEYLPSGDLTVLWESEQVNRQTQQPYSKAKCEALIKHRAAALARARG